jgi:hypothetical protein
MDEHHEPNDLKDPVFTCEELAEQKKLHPTTVRRLFVNEPGVIRLGRSGDQHRRRYFTLRIPATVAARVFRRLSVGTRGTPQ